MTEQQTDKLGRTWTKHGTGRWKWIDMSGNAWRTDDPPPYPHNVAIGRPETEPCERGVVGCCITHYDGDEGCRTW